VAEAFFEDPPSTEIHKKQGFSPENAALERFVGNI
jgi:hypothetical protein